MRLLYGLAVIVALKEILFCHCLSVIVPSFGKLPSSMVVTTRVPATLDQCARWCISLAACKSVGHHMRTKTCELYAVDNVTVSTEFEQGMGWLHMSLDKWPKSVGGLCDNHTCGLAEMCQPKGDGITCVQIKDGLSCESSPCQHGTCYETIDSFVCHCDPGYTGTICDEDILECASNPCQNNGDCNELVNGYNCTCPFDFVGDHCETYRCTDFSLSTSLYRLCDGNGEGMPSLSRGRLEYYFGGEWGTICDDYWAGQTIEPIFEQNPVVACKMLGFSGGYAFSNAYFGKGQGPIYMRSLQCSGHEAGLHDCVINSLYECSHIEDVGVACY